MSQQKHIQVVISEGDRPSRILLDKELRPDERSIVLLKQGKDLPDLLGQGEFDVLVQDLELPSGGGQDSLRMIRASSQGVDAVVVSEDTEGGREPLPGENRGYSYLTRPLTPSEIRQLVESGPGSAADTQRTKAIDVVPSHRRRAFAQDLIGESPKILELLATVQRVAASTASVMIRGETGTGKSLIARGIHQASGRKDKPFVVINCAALQEQLLESELFGHEKGAFTGAVGSKEGLFEVAHGGTLFLDEVGEMSPSMQAKLLSVLDTGELRRVGGTRTRKVDVRVVTATNRDLEAEVRSGHFREDLQFRLNVISLTVPPLRDRKDDIALLVEAFLDRFRSSGHPAKTIAPTALELLKTYSWPGNVRELANTVEGLTLLAPGPEIRAEDLPPNLRPSGKVNAESGGAPLPLTEIERFHISRVLRYTEGKKAPAARLLGIDVKTLKNKMRNYNIEA